jgi:hypothetical protein
LIIAVEKVIALYPFNANNSDELTFQKHDVIAVIDREDIDWWEGELNGKTGFFPGTRLRLGIRYILASMIYVLIIMGYRIKRSTVHYCSK